jgi:hypothetical protein
MHTILEFQVLRVISGHRAKPVEVLGLGFVDELGHGGDVGGARIDGGDGGLWIRVKIFTFTSHD